MGTMDLIRTWNTRYNNDRTPVAAVALRDVAARQAAVLQAIASTGRKTAARIDMEARVAAVRVAQQAPAPVARPAVASVPQGKGRPDFKQVDELAATIPVGMYALPRREDATNGKQPVYFFKVHKFHSGHRIVMVTGGVGAFTEIPMKVTWQLRALEGIAADVKGAAARFGHEVAECGFCAANGRRSPLTHERSRKAGYGQHCADKHGLPW